MHHGAANTYAKSSINNCKNIVGANNMTWCNCIIEVCAAPLSAKKRKKVCAAPLSAKKKKKSMCCTSKFSCTTNHTIGGNFIIIILRKKKKKYVLHLFQQKKKKKYVLHSFSKKKKEYVLHL